MTATQSAIRCVRSVRSRRIIGPIMLARFSVPCFSVSTAVANLHVVRFSLLGDPLRNQLSIITVHRNQDRIGNLVQIQKACAFTSRAIGHRPAQQVGQLEPPSSRGFQLRLLAAAQLPWSLGGINRNQFLSSFDSRSCLHTTKSRETLMLLRLSLPIDRSAFAASMKPDETANKKACHMHQ